MAHFHDNALIGASGQGGYQISRSLRFNSADSAYLSRAAWLGNRRLHTFSFWVKRTAFGSRQTLFGNTNSIGFYGLYFEFNSDDTLLIGDYSTSWQWQLNTTARYRDPSAWYHIVLAVDTANATAANRVKLYVNGSEVTAFLTASYMSQNYDTYWNYNSYTVAIGRLGEYNGQYFNGYLTEINFIDGQALTPSSFGETDTITGVWKPKKYAGTYGTNGFYLNFSDNSGTTSTTLGKDSSGNSNNWTPNYFSVTAGAGNDSLIDTPTPYADGGNGRGNYATFAPTIVSSQGTATLANGNLDISGSGSSYTGGLSSIAVASGKWYWEYTVNSVGSASGPGIIATTSLSSAVGGTYGFSAASDGWYRYQTYVATNSSIPVSGLSSLTTSDVAMIALDVDAGKLWFGRNGTWESSGNPATGANATITFTPGGKSFYAFAQGYGSWSGTFNAGQRPFAYTPPSGFVALNTQNLPEPSIKKPSSYMDVVTYTGNGGTQTLSSLNFSPDLVWIKGRSVAYDHQLTDSVRGTGKELQSNGTGSETSYGLVSALNSNGFTVFTNGTYLASNATGTTYVAWCWDESATPGFDIVTYTGNGSNRTIAHSLGVAPNFMMVKDRTSGSNGGAVYHSSLGNTKYLKLFQTTTGTDGEATDSTVWNNTTPTSSVFSVGTSVRTNANTDNYVAYLWSEVAGFSRFGSYTGNGSSDGPFVFCGFRPRWILFKRTSTGYWGIYDAVRDTYNTLTSALYPNDSLAEGVDQPFDFLSNGFKVRGTTTFVNSSGSTYIFAAFAETPQKYSLAR